jgi:hypothetical protein
MVETRRRSADSAKDESGYGDLPSGAVGYRGLTGRDYRGGYGGDADRFQGGVVDAGHGGPPDDSGFAPARGHDSGFAAFGGLDPSDPAVQAERPRQGGRSLRGRGPKNYRRSDERIREDLCERLTDDSIIDASEVEVRVEEREITLAGFVHDRPSRRRAEDIAEGISGVTNVRNDLRIRERG